MRHGNILFGLLGLLLIACNNNNAEKDNGIPYKAVAKEDTAEVHAEAGRPVFEQRCAACHGSDGTAGIAGAANLQVSQVDSIAITKIIGEGKGGMPPFASQLSTEEIAAVSHFVLTLRKR